MNSHQQPQARTRRSSPSPFQHQPRHRFSKSFNTTAILGVLGTLLSHAQSFSFSTFHLATPRRGILVMPSTITSLKSSTLNEDGDFCIEGINDDKTTNNNSSGNNNNNNNNNNEFTSLLDMEYNQIKNSKLSDITKPYQFAETNPQDDVRFETTDDDYIPNDDTEVIIMDQFSSFLNAGVQGATARPAYNDLSTADRVDSTNTVLPSVSTGIESQSGRSNSQVVPQSQNRIALDEKDHAAIEALEGFLSSIFDGQVKARDIHLYACDLVAIGFDPDCDMGKELEFDDLEFMKKLHQRFFWKEWQRLLL